MTITFQSIIDAVKTNKMEAFGLAMPLMATDWLKSAGTIQAQEIDMTIMTADSSGDTTKGPHWLAPLGCHLYTVDLIGNTPMPVTLMKPDGSAENSSGVLLTVFEQSWLRLCRLYTQVLEDSSNTSSRPEYAKNLPWRQVPKYFFFSGATSTIKQGFAEAGAELDFAGTMRIYDGDGLPIDPVAVIAAFLAIQKKYSAFETPTIGSSDTIPLENYLNKLATSTETRIRLVTPDGSPCIKPATADNIPRPSDNLTNIAAVTGLGTIGVYKISASSGSSSSSQTSIGVAAVNATTFPTYRHDRLVFGPATSGRLTNSFTPPTPPTSSGSSSSSTSVTLKRDFFTLRVVELNTYLPGVWPIPSAEASFTVQRQATVRMDENVTFLADGNDVYGAINAALTGSTLRLMVAQALDGTFDLPSATGAKAHWPIWPANATATAATLSIDLKNALTLTANWFVQTPPSVDPTNADVVLKITGLPADIANAWLRVYPRKFRSDADAAEERGDGQGGAIQAGGTISLYLTDPLSLRDPTDAAGSSIHRPLNASLMFDMIVVLPNGKSRIYGNLSVKIGTTAVTNPSPAAGSNPGSTAEYRGISKSGVLGLGTPGHVPAGNLSFAKDDWAKLLRDNTQPRDAPRLPTMARRELLAAAKGTSLWSGVIAGGQLAKEGICADARTGEPGGSGGRETILVGASTNGGRLAYDIARHAFRRTTNIVDRMVALNDTKWNTPDAPTAVSVGGTPAPATAPTNGTFAGAVLQTVAPNCETPELGLVPATVDAQILVNNIKAYLDTQLANNQTIKTAVDNAINPVVPDVPQPIDESSPALRLAAEAQREIASAYYGRRDALWALQTAIQNARHCIYIETPGFCSTVNNPNMGGFTADLITALRDQLLSRPGLTAVICTPKYPDFAPGYDGFLAYEVNDRLAVMKTLPARQAVLFHPIGFPGRFARVETNVVIVDDVWAMVGGSSFRRRGLAGFDSASDLVVTDTLIENGRSAAIRDFRRTLMAKRLGIAEVSTEPSYVALNCGDTAFALVRATLDAGGLGKISPVWDGKTPGKELATALSIDVANPDGRLLDVAALMTSATIATAATSSGL